MFTETSKNGIVKFIKILTFLKIEDAGNWVTDFGENIRLLTVFCFCISSEESFKDRFMKVVPDENYVNNTSQNWRDWSFLREKYTGWVPAKFFSHAESRK